MTADGSVTRWVTALKDGDAAAAQPLWERYHRRLVGLARRKLAAPAAGAADEEDVVQNAFHSFFRGVAGGRFPQLDDRDNLWRLLVVITARKALDQLAHEHSQAPGRWHGSGPNRGYPPGGRPGGRRPSSRSSATNRRPNSPPRSPRSTNGCSTCSATTRCAASPSGRWRADRRRIAERLDCSRRTVARKLETIRIIWTSESSFGRARLRRAGCSSGSAGASPPDRSEVDAVTENLVSAVSPAAARQIDQACDRFEASWKTAGLNPAARPPDPVEALRGFREPARSTLLRQLLLLDWEYRRRAGDEPRRRPTTSPASRPTRRWSTAVERRDGRGRRRTHVGANGAGRLTVVRRRTRPGRGSTPTSAGPAATSWPRRSAAGGMGVVYRGPRPPARPGGGRQGAGRTVPRSAGRPPAVPGRGPDRRPAPAPRHPRRSTSSARCPTAGRSWR